MDNEYKKEFDRWNFLKKKIDSNNKKIFYHEREIWWSSLGVNIGSEEDGKNELYERPILIVNGFGLEMCRIIPLTSKSKSDKFHFKINYLENTEGYLILSQMKTISTKRLTRKMCRLNKEQFNTLKAQPRKDFN